jgi:hypothetical protein
VKYVEYAEIFMEINKKGNGARISPLEDICLQVHPCKLNGSGLQKAEVLPPRTAQGGDEPLRVAASVPDSSQ